MCGLAGFGFRVSGVSGLGFSLGAEHLSPKKANLSEL